MASVVSRAVLGVCAALAIVGGATLAVMAVVYFGADEYIPELQVGGYGVLAGMVGLGVYVAGAFRAHLAVRIVAGVGAVMAGTFASVVAAYLVSLTADRGGPQGNLEDGAIGFIWLLAGAYFAWRIAAGRWPAKQQRAGEA